MSDIAYYRVSSGGQSIEAQRSALSGPLRRPFDKEFIDSAVSGKVPADQRPGFGQVLAYVREGDTLHVFSIDQLGRDALDVQRTVRLLLDKDVALEVRGLGRIARGVGELIVAVLAQIAQMERDAIRERCDAGRALARASLGSSGRTHRGKESLGRRPKCDPEEVRSWRETNEPVSRRRLPISGSAWRR